MTVWEVVLILFVLALMLPVWQRRLLEGARKKVRARIEADRGSRVILLVHRQETLSLFGVPLMRYIDIQDSEAVIQAIRETPPEVPIDIVLHTPGGLALASLQIARALARHPATVTAMVPHYAMSGGTLIALAADRICMCEHAVLGPIDPQIGPYPAASILRAVERKSDDHIDDEILILADQSEMAIEQLRRAVVDLIGDRQPTEITEYIADELSQGRWTHDYPITPDEAKRLGLEIDLAMPDDVLVMMSLFPQPMRSARSVEYESRPRARPRVDRTGERAPDRPVAPSRDKPARPAKPKPR